jgi:ubiquinone/menaquinone biosynthesis C-methylase UbiE
MLAAQGHKMTTKSAAAFATQPRRIDERDRTNVHDLFEQPESQEYPYDTVTQRSELDLSCDESYAKYWLSEYGTEPDQIRVQDIFPLIQPVVSKYADQGLIIDFGCGPGSCLNEFFSWRPTQYIGVDVNKDFLELANEKYKDRSNIQFYRRDFDDISWFKDTPSNFDLGVSLFLLNELKHPDRFLYGARQLVKAKRGRLALVFTNPVLLLKDLTDYYLLGANRRKFEGVEGYRNSDGGRYVYSRGDYSVNYYHHSLTTLNKIFWDCGWRQQYFSEVYFTPGRHQDNTINRNMIENQYPKALFVLLEPKGHSPKA